MECISGDVGRAGTFPPEKDAETIRPIASPYHLYQIIDGTDPTGRHIQLSPRVPIVIEATVCCVTYVETYLLLYHNIYFWRNLFEQIAKFPDLAGRGDTACG